MVEEIIVKEYSEQYSNEIIDLILDIQQNEFILNSESK